MQFWVSALHPHSGDGDALFFRPAPLACGVDHVPLSKEKEISFELFKQFSHTGISVSVMSALRDKANIRKCGGDVR